MSHLCRSYVMVSEAWGNVHWLPQKSRRRQQICRFPLLFTHGCIVKLDELTKEGESLSFKGSREYWIWSCIVENCVNTNQIQAKSTTHVQQSKESLDLCNTGVFVLSFYLSLKAWPLSSHITLLLLCLWVPLPSWDLHQWSSDSKLSRQCHSFFWLTRLALIPLVNLLLFFFLRI